MQRMNADQNGLALELFVAHLIECKQNNVKTTVKETAKQIDYGMLQSKDKPGYCFKTPDSWASWINQTLLKKLSSHADDSTETTDDDCFGLSQSYAKKILDLYHAVGGGGSRGAKKATINTDAKKKVLGALDALDV